MSLEGSTVPEFQETTELQNQFCQWKTLWGPSQCRKQKMCSRLQCFNYFGSDGYSLNKVLKKVYPPAIKRGLPDKSPIYRSFSLIFPFKPPSIEDFLAIFDYRSYSPIAPRERPAILVDDSHALQGEETLHLPVASVLL